METAANKIDIERFISSYLCESTDSPEGRKIIKCLNEQGLCYVDGKIKFILELGKKYVCIRDFWSNGVCYAKRGEVVLVQPGMEIMSLSNPSDFFRKATDEESRTDFVELEPENATIEPKFNVGDIMRTKEEVGLGITEGCPVVVRIDDKNYYCNNETIPIALQDNYEYPAVNAKPESADNKEVEKTEMQENIKRKFKDGQYVSDGNSVLHILEVVNAGGKYVYRTDKGPKDMQYVDRMYHKFWFDDIHEGDVIHVTCYNADFDYETGAFIGVYRNCVIYNRNNERKYKVLFYCSVLEKSPYWLSDDEPECVELDYSFEFDKHFMCIVRPATDLERVKIARVSHLAKIWNNDRRSFNQRYVDELVFNFKNSSDKYNDKRVSDIYRKGVEDAINMFFKRFSKHSNENKDSDRFLKEEHI